MSEQARAREKHRPSCATNPWNQGASAECSCDDWRESKQAETSEPRCECRWTPGIDLPTYECVLHRDDPDLAHKASETDDA
jgi:hypothetical protein